MELQYKYHACAQATTLNENTINQCHIVSEAMDNVSDHLPVGMELRVELCKVKTGKCPVTTGMPSDPPANWTNDARNEQYRNIVREKLLCIPPLTLDSKQWCQNGRKLYKWPCDFL